MADTGDDPLGNEVSVTGELTETGLKAGAKSRLVAAFDRLGGNIVDLFNPPLERWKATYRAKTDGKLKVIRAFDDAVAKRIANDDTLFGRAVESHIEAIIIKQLNKDAVIARTIEDLRTSPREEFQGDPEVSADLDQDWLNYFVEYAEKASSSHMRIMWARVLSGQVRKPGAFSFNTMRIIAELEPQLAQIFQALVSLRIDGEYVVSPTNGPLAELDALLSLQTAGLIQDAMGFLGRKFERGTDGFVGATVGKVVVRGTLKQGLDSANVTVIGLTRAGQQIAAILPFDERGAALSLAKAFLQDCATVHIHNRLPNSEDRFEKLGEEVTIASA